MYFIAVLYISTVLASYGYAYFNLFLKSLKNADGTKTWTTSQVNAIPIGGGAIQVVFGMFYNTSIVSERTDKNFSMDLGSLIRLLWHEMDPHHSSSSHWLDPNNNHEYLDATSSFCSFVSCLCQLLYLVYLFRNSSLDHVLVIRYVSFQILKPGTKLTFHSIPQDPEARSLIIGVTIAGYYAISAWSQVLVWPAVQAPYCTSVTPPSFKFIADLEITDKYGWQSALALWVVVIIMTCILRYIDVRYMLYAPRIHEYESIPNNIELCRPKRIAFAHDINAEDDSEDGHNVVGESDDLDSKTGKDVKTKVVASES